MDKSSWERKFDDSKPLITHAIISGVDSLQIAKIFLNLMQNISIKEFTFHPELLDHMPRRARKYTQMPKQINDFIFPNGLRIVEASGYSLSPKIVDVYLTI
jgi:hypothetical protein